MDGLTFPQALSQLDELLDIHSPKIAQSLRPPASSDALDQLREQALGGRPIPLPLEQWFGWHNGQRPNPHRGLDPRSFYRRLVSIEEVPGLMKQLAADDIQHGWVPVSAEEDDVSDALGLFTTGPIAGQMGRANGEVYIESFAHFARAMLIKHHHQAHASPDPGHRWVLAMASPLTEDNRHCHRLLGGVWPLTQGKTCWNILTHWWDIDNRDALWSTLDWLEGAGHRTGTHDPKAYLAWDLCRAAALAGLGANVGLVTRQEAWDRSLRCARVIQTELSSWREVGESYAAGRKRFMDNDDQAFLGRLYDDPTGPFSLPWGTPLCETPPAPPPVERLEVGPHEFERLNHIVAHFRSVRTLELQLRPGVHTLEAQVETPVVLRGATDNAEDTVVQAFHRNDACCIRQAARLEHLTLEHVGALSDNEKWAAVYVWQGHLEMEGCVVEGSDAGVVFEDATGTVRDTKFMGTPVGIRVCDSGWCSMLTSQIHSVRRGVQMSGGTLRASGCEVTSDQFGVHASKAAGLLTMVDCKIFGGTTAVSSWGHTTQLHRCELSSDTHEVVHARDKTQPDQKEARVSLKSCTLGPSANRLLIAHDALIVAEDCRLGHNGGWAAGALGEHGALTLNACTSEHGIIFANMGRLTLEQCNVGSPEGDTLQCVEGGTIDVLNSIVDGALIEERRFDKETPT